MKPPAWKKLGLVFQPTADVPWRASHASTPTAEVLSDTVVRVYFTSRDAGNRSHISSLEFDLRRPTEARNLSSSALVAPGGEGAFDQDGAAMGCLVVESGRRWLYYLGWRLATDVPWRNSIGLAVADGDGVQFEKISDDPVLGLSDVDPFSVSYPWILRERDRWRMWYGSNLAWGASQESMRHVIKVAESADGKRWVPSGQVAVPLREDGLEYAVARPCVIRDPGGYRMWFSRRSPDYRIGYADSVDGLTWTRRDTLAGIEPSPGGWDGRATEYACVFDAGGERYMLYNGDDYGRQGFGLAVRIR